MSPKMLQKLNVAKNVFLERITLKSSPIGDISPNLASLFMTDCDLTEIFIQNKTYFFNLNIIHIIRGGGAGELAW
jgi:hypothetical protein